MSSDRECTVCYESKAEAEYVAASLKCTHQGNVCRGCLRTEITTVITKNSANLRCPSSACRAEMHVEDVRRVLQDEAQASRFSEIVFRNYIHAQPDFFWCAQAGCGSGQEVEGGVAEANWFRCIKCNGLTCVHHRAVMHEGLTCEQYDQVQARVSEEDASAAYIRDNTRACPNCETPCAKIDDNCDIVRCESPKCRAAKFRFCWRCQCDMAPVIKHGNHFHKTTCAWYFEG
eukprot:TRINITY_DN600_c0_g1_i1.p2 TRINITY_DN600_c0_g1~~TRINITY_DN600_c0_g1_i1.p2  ORF type:complete len:231 (-),score=66.26 TRINITY_DN600_c0_g1_i1:224-916(-)